MILIHLVENTFTSYENQNEKKTNLPFSCYLIAIIYQDFFERAILNKKISKETLESKTLLSSMTKINCKRHFL